MPLGTPIVLTLYGPDDEVVGEYSRARIPVVFAERAMELSDSLGENGEMTKDQLITLYQIIIDFFGGKFTMDDLRSGADLGELMSVIMEISQRVANLMPANPTIPGKKPRT